MWNLKKSIDDVAVIQEPDTIVTYFELSQYIDNLSNNIPDRSLVFCLCNNSIGSLIGYVAFLNAKIVPLMLEDDVDRGLLDSLINIYHPEYFWIPSKIEGYFENCVSIYSDHDFTLLKSSISQKPILHNDLALLLSTSGSTGSKKLVRLSYENLRSNTESIVEYLEIDGKERSITTLPMSYSYGLSIINSYLQAAASIVMTNKTLVQKEFWSLLKNHNVTSFGGVPFTYEMLNRLKFFQMELPSLRVLTQAGGKLSLELQRKFAKYARENGKRFYVMYGQTEASPRISYLPYERSIDRCGSIGVPIPGGQLYLVDENKNKIDDHESIGELVYMGKNVSLGYAEKLEDLDKGDQGNGVLYTGDLAKVDSEGFFWITGRKKRFLKIFGNRVNLDEIEELLKNKFSEVDIACNGVDDKIFIYVTNEGVSSDITEYISSKTGLNFHSFSVRYISEIPKNKSGKTAYTNLNNVFEQ